MSFSPVATFRNFWSRLWLRRSHFSGRYSDLERLYTLKDPWDLASSREQARFVATNRAVERVAPGCQSLLEIGCGEGLQTEHLAKVSRSVAGLDVSAQAVERARQRLPRVEFQAGPAEDVAALFPGRRFDLATAFEVLYYMPDVPRVIATLQGLADAVLVTSFSNEAEKVRAQLTGPGWSELEPISAEGTDWRVFYWKAA